MANILIVDDSITSRKMLRNILEDAGHSVAGEATNGEDGVKMYGQLKPDLVTLDITMPVMDGLEALRGIREQNPAARVIMITAAGQNGKIVDAIKLGAAEFITKPFERDQIVEVIGRILGK